MGGALHLHAGADKERVIGRPPHLHAGGVKRAVRPIESFQVLAMTRRYVARASVLASVTFLLFGILVGFRSVATAGKDPADKESSAKDVFGPTKVWTLHLEIPAREYEALQPSGGGFGFGGPPAKKPAPKKPMDKRETERNLFG